MCGILGFIGKSKNPQITYQIATSLFEKTELRGKDAAGFWGVEEGDGRILYHKEPGRSRDFVKKEMWRKLTEVTTDLLLAHARDASVGSPLVNKNNHPFVNSEKSIAIIHNGKIPDPEYTCLRKKYEVLSDCDSEILLRIFESGDTKLSGIKDIWSFLSRKTKLDNSPPPAMAVAIGEKLPNGCHKLWLFRNNYRSVWVVDLREALGQIFFCSTDAIWHQAMFNCPAVKFIRKTNVKLVEVPPEEVWSFETSPDSPNITNETLKKFEIIPGDSIPWEPDADPFVPLKGTISPHILTILDENDEISKKPFDLETKGYIALCDEIQELVLDINSHIENCDDISPWEHNELLDRLSSIKLDLIGTLRILQR